jgi:hypothetical protein
MNKERLCSACGVKIIGEEVHFSHGKPGTKERLHARVCQFAKKPGCINNLDSERIENIPDQDFYQEF